MLRRVHVSAVRIGLVPLEPDEAHHIRDVLRLEVGSPLELFDSQGRTAQGTIRHLNPQNVVVEVEAVTAGAIQGVHVTVASAVPKGDRADWMVEKLTELGVARFIPLITERSVVLPAGRNKIERWERIAVEAAKQSRRSGVMAIAALTPLEEAIRSIQAGWYFSTAAGAIASKKAVLDHPAMEYTLLIGPEGGWSPVEIDRMNRAGLTAVALTATVLRVETAAVVAAGMVLCLDV
jgi:16S rRNA (uracil1498-N3)-methyltransferase